MFAPFSRFLALLLMFSGCLGWAAPAPAPGRPNILFILVDDLGWGDLGVFHQNRRAREGKPAIQTPALDRMAAEGIQLCRHYAGSPVCAPSRASLFSGVHQGHARVVRDNTFDMPLEDALTLPAMLKKAGYATALIGKWGIGGGTECGGNPGESTAFPDKRGFDYFFGHLDHIGAHRHYAADDPADRRSQTGTNVIWDMHENITKSCTNSYSTDLFTARAKKWIVDHRKKSRGQPFFLALTFTAPHSALEVPTQAYPAGAGLNGGLQWLGKKGELINTANGVRNSYVYPRYASQKWPEGAKKHASMIARIDDAVGDLLKLLSDLKIDKNTIVVFTSDNGPHNEGSFIGPTQDPNFFESYGPFDGIKRDTWEAGIRVPAIVRWPAAIPSGRVSHAPSQFHDWMATFAEAGGMPVPSKTDGVSILPTLTGKGKQKPGILYVEYNVKGKTPNYKNFLPEHRNVSRLQQQIIYAGRYKGVRQNIRSHEDPFQIYDIEKDPRESRNLAETPEGRKYGDYFRNRVLQVRRIYDYDNSVRGCLAGRPYDSVPVPPLEKGGEVGGKLAFRLLSSKACPWVPKPEAVRGYENLAVTETSGCLVPDGISRQPFCGEWKGFLSVPETGVYTFFLETDSNEGSKSFVRLHDMQLVDADFHYKPGDRADSSSAVGTTECSPETGKKGVPLAKGAHPVSIGYVHGAGASKAGLKLMWSRDGGAPEEIPASCFSMSAR